MKRYSLIPRSGTLMTLSLFLPMIDSSAMMSAIFSRIDSRTFWRWRKRSPAERSERSDSVGRYSRKMVSLLICRPGPLSLVGLYYDVSPDTMQSVNLSAVKNLLEPNPPTRKSREQLSQPVAGHHANHAVRPFRRV